MAKRTHIIDLHKMPFPFGQEYVDNQADPLGQGVLAGMHSNIKVIEMANVLPTPEGMVSFFGTRPLNLPALGQEVEIVFTYKDKAGNNTLIALGEFGAQFSNDGVTWDTTEAILTPSTIQGTAYTYSLVDNLSNTLLGYLSATLTIASPGPSTYGIKATPSLPVPVGTPANEIIDVQVIEQNPTLNAVALPDASQLRWRPWLKNLPGTVKYVDYSGFTPVVGERYTISHRKDYWYHVVASSENTPELAMDAIHRALGNTWMAWERLPGTMVYKYTWVDNGSNYWQEPAFPYIAPRDFGTLKADFNAGLLTPILSVPYGANTEMRMEMPSSAYGNYGILYITSATPNAYGGYIPASYSVDVYLPGQDNLKYYNRLGWEAAGGTWDNWANWGFEGASTNGYTGAKTPAWDAIIVPIRPGHVYFRDWTGGLNGQVHLIDTGIPVIGNEVGSPNSDGAVNVLFQAAKIANTVVHFRGADSLAPWVWSYTITAAEAASVTGAATPAAQQAALEAIVNTMATQMCTAQGLTLHNVLGTTIYTSATYPITVDFTTTAAAPFPLSYGTRRDFYHIVNMQAHGNVWNTLRRFNKVTGLRITSQDAQNLTSGIQLIVQSLGIPVLAYTIDGTVVSDATGRIPMTAFPPNGILDLYCTAPHWYIQVQVDKTGYIAPAVPSATLGNFLVESFNIVGEATWHTMGDSLPYEWLYRMQASVNPQPAGTIANVEVDLLGKDANGYYTIPAAIPASEGYLATPVWHNIQDLVFTSAIGSALTNAQAANALTAPTYLNPVQDVANFQAPYHSGASPQTQGSVDLLITADPTTPLPATHVATLSYANGAAATPVTLVSSNPMHFQKLDAPRVDFPTPIKRSWSYCMLKNRLYAYRAGDAYILRMSLDGLSWERVVPTFVTMSSMEGIFAARGRLGMWDTAGAIYTSSDIILDTTTDPVTGAVTPNLSIDFTPSVSTLANVVTPLGVKGRIISILEYLDGFIVYASSSIVQASYIGGSEVFKYTVLSSHQGILSPRSVCNGKPGTQYVATGQGIYAIINGVMKELDMKLSRYMQSSQLYARLTYLQNRYLAVSFAPSVPARVVSSVQTYAPTVLPGSPAVPGTPSRTIKGFTVPTRTIKI